MAKNMKEIEARILAIEKNTEEKITGMESRITELIRKLLPAAISEPPPAPPSSVDPSKVDPKTVFEDASEDSATSDTPFLHMREENDSEVMALWLTQLRGANLKEPSLRSWDKKSFRQFSREYEQYKLKGGLIPMYLCMEPMFLEAVASEHLVSVGDLQKLSYKSFVKVVASHWETHSVLETLRNLQAVKMDGTSSMAFETMVLNFRFELSLSWRFPVPEKKLIKVFIQALKPNEIQDLVTMMGHTDLEEVIKEARTQIDLMRQLSQTAQAYGKRLEPLVNSKLPSGNTVAQSTGTVTYPDKKQNSGSEQSKDFLRTWKCAKCNRLGHKMEECRTLPQNYLSREEGSRIQKEAKAKLAATSEKWATSSDPQNKRTGSGPPLPSGSQTTLTPGQPKSTVQLKAVSIREVSVEQVDQLISEQELFNKPQSPAYLESQLSSQLAPHWKSVKVFALADSGANHNVLAPQMFDLLPSEVQLSFSEKQLRIKVADGQPSKLVFCKVGTLQIQVFSSQSHSQWITVTMIVYDSGEPLIIGLDTILQHSLWKYVANQARDMYHEQDVLEEDIVSDIAAIQVSEAKDTIAILDPNLPDRSQFESLLSDYAGLFGTLSPDRFIKVPPIKIQLKEGATFKRFHPRRVPPNLMEALSHELQVLMDMGHIRKSDSPMASPIVIVPKKDGGIRLCVDYKVHVNSIIEDVRWPLPFIADILARLRGKHHYYKLDLSRGFHQLRIAEESQFITAFICPLGTYCFTRLPFGIATAPMIFQAVMAEILEPVRDQIAGNLIDDIAGGEETSAALYQTLRALFARCAEYGVSFNIGKCAIGYPTLSVLGYEVSSSGIRMLPQRIQALLQLPTPRTLKQLRQFLGVTNYFKQFVPQYAILAQPLTSHTHIFEWGPPQETAFQSLRDAISNVQLLHHLTYDLPIILRVDASDRGLGGVLLNVAQDEERIVTYLSLAFSAAARNWSVIEKEVYAAVYCLVQLEPVLAGVPFILQTDHRNMLWLSKATAPKLVRWRLRIQSFNFQIQHIPGNSNVIADQLSRIYRLQLDNPTTGPRIDQISKVHNHISGHRGIQATVALLKKSGATWDGINADVAAFIHACPTCQKIREFRDTRSSSELHRLIGEPFECIALDSVGPLPVSEDGYQHIQVIIDECTKFVFLFPTRSTDAREGLASLNFITGIFGTIKSIMSDNGPQYINDLFQAYCQFWQIEHRTSLPFRPQSNGVVERVNGEVLRHLRAIIFDKRVKPKWVLYLPMVQRIINSSYHSALGASPIQFLFGDFITVDRGLLTAWDEQVPAEGATPGEYLAQLNTQLLAVAEASRRFQTQAVRDRLPPPGAARKEFALNDFVLIKYPSSAPNKLAPRLRGPMMIVDVYKNTYSCLDLLSNRVTRFDVSRLLRWNSPSWTSAEDASTSRTEAAMRDQEEYIVESIISHRGQPNRRKTLEFQVRWLGYGPDDDSWLPYSELRNNAALDPYIEAHPELRVLNRR